MNKIILELTEIEANTLEAMIQANLETNFTEETFDKCLKESGDCAKTFLVAQWTLETIRDRLKEKREERHNKDIKAANDIVSIVESMLNNEEESKENK